MPEPANPDPLPKYIELAPGKTSRRVERDMTTGKTHYHIYEDTGLFEHPDTGFATQDIRNETWTIATDDPSVDDRRLDLDLHCQTRKLVGQDRLGLADRLHGNRMADIRLGDGLRRRNADLPKDLREALSPRLYVTVRGPCFGQGGKRPLPVCGRHENVVVVIGRNHVGADAVPRQRRRDRRGQANRLERRMHRQRDAAQHRPVSQAGAVGHRALEDQRYPFILAEEAERRQRKPVLRFLSRHRAIDIFCRTQVRAHVAQEHVEIGDSRHIHPFLRISHERVALRPASHFGVTHAFAI